MLKIILAAILMMNAIFWGIFPPSTNSPHTQLRRFFGIDYYCDKDRTYYIRIGFLYRRCINSQASFY